MKYVILGVGAAGMTAAETIRKLQPEDEIIMISEDIAVHSRCMLHKYLSHERDEQSLNFTPDSFFADHNITWLKGTSVTGIDPETKTITAGTAEITYDKLLISTGANSIIPPIGQLKTAPNVYGLRHLSDARAIDEKLASASQIVIIGSGLVGMDAAYSFLDRGKTVTIVEMADRILPLQLDDHAAKTYQETFESKGCTFKLGRKAAGTSTDEHGSITHLILENGEELPCDMVLAAAGVRPAIDFLDGSSISCDRTLKVDSYLQTNVADIYAAGDVTGLSGIWPNAIKQGKTAARNMCGIATAYTDLYAVKNTINFYGITTLSIGEFNPEEHDIVLIRKDQNHYSKLILRDDVPVGIILQGDISNSGFWQYLIKNKISLANIDKSPWDISFADFYDMKPNGEYQWTLPASDVLEVI